MNKLKKPEKFKNHKKQLSHNGKLNLRENSDIQNPNKNSSIYSEQILQEKLINKKFKKNIKQSLTYNDFNRKFTPETIKDQLKINEFKMDDDNENKIKENSLFEKVKMEIEHNNSDFINKLCNFLKKSQKHIDQTIFETIKEKNNVKYNNIII